MDNNGVIYEVDTSYCHYQVIDTIYNGRPARLLYSGQREAAQSGEARDGQPELLFDYNQRFLELAQGLQPRQILLIGGGAYTLPKALLSTLPSTYINVVEKDPALINIAKKFFNFAPKGRTKISHSDGLWFLDNNVEVYDLILIDAFIHSEIPQNLKTKEAAMSIARRLRPDGVAAINIISAYYGGMNELLFSELAALKAAFKHIQIFPANFDVSLWLPQNLLLVAQNGNHNLDHLLRFDQLDLPEIIKGNKTA